MLTTTEEIFDYSNGQAVDDGQAYPDRVGRSTAGDSLRLAAIVKCAELVQVKEVNKTVVTFKGVELVSFDDGGSPSTGFPHKVRDTHFSDMECYVLLHALICRCVSKRVFSPENTIDKVLYCLDMTIGYDSAEESSPPF